MRRTVRRVALAVAALSVGTLATVSPLPAGAIQSLLQAPARLSDTTDDALGDESVVVDGSGKAYAVFTVKRDGQKSILQSTRSPGGSWSTTELVHGLVGQPDIAVGDGYVVVVWQKNVTPTDTDPGHAEIWCTRYNGDLSDFNTGQISNPEHNATDPQVVVDSSGRATVMWSDDDRDPIHPDQFDHNPHMYFRTSQVANPGLAGTDLCDFGGTDLGTVSPSSEVASSHLPFLAVDGQGNVTAAWDEVDDSGPTLKTVVVARREAGTGTFGTSTLVDATSPNSVAVLDIAATDAGPSTAGDVTVGVVSYTGSYKIALATRFGAGPDAGLWSSAALPTSGAGTGVSLWQSGPDGGTTAALVTGSSGSRAIQVVDRPEGSGTWSDPVTISSGGDNTQPDGGSAADGSSTVVWLSSGASALVARHRNVDATWDAAVPVPVKLDPDYPQTASSFVDDAPLLWNEFGTVGKVWGSVLGRAPVKAKMTKPTALLAPSNRIAIAWTSTGGSGTVYYDVQRRFSEYYGDLGKYQYVWLGTFLTSDTPLAHPGTVCFRVRATDDLGTGPWSAEKCTGVPIDDRGLTRKSGFALKKGKGYFERTYQIAKVQGSTLVLENVKAKTFGLMVAKGPGYGKVQVLFNGTSLGTWNLAAAKLQKQVILTVKKFATVKKGTLTIRVVTGGKPVVIDAAYARR